MQGTKNMNVLFDSNGKPFAPKDIRKSIENFGHGYNQVVHQVIENSDRLLDKGIFRENIATLIPNFKMTRKGPLEGIKIDEGEVQDPNGIIARCWAEVGTSAMALKELLNQQNKGRVRVIVEMTQPLRKRWLEGYG